MPENTHADVLIIGAGPAGSAAAIQLGQMGVQNVVLVDRHDFPRHKTCGSGISPKGMEVLKSLGVWDTVMREAYSINGLRLVTPGNIEMVVSGGDETVALICQRRLLDDCLLKRAVSFGARFMPAFEADTLLFEGNRVRGATARDGRTVQAKYTVVANGAHSRFTLPSKTKRTLHGIMGWWENVPFRANHVEMIFDESLVPHYGWLFPESASRVNIGICYEDCRHEKNSKTLFEQFLKKYYQARLSDAVQIDKWKGHPISYSYRVGRLQSPGRLIVGEAGRITHPATGEGIYQGMRSGVLAAHALHEALSDPAFEKRAWSAYEESCRRAFRTSFLSAKVWRGAVNSPLLDFVVNFGQKPAVKRALSKIMSLM